MSVASQGGCLYARCVVRKMSEGSRTVPIAGEMRWPKKIRRYPSRTCRGAAEWRSGAENGSGWRKSNGLDKSWDAPCKSCDIQSRDPRELIVRRAPVEVCINSPAWKV